MFLLCKLILLVIGVSSNGHRIKDSSLGLFGCACESSVDIFHNDYSIVFPDYHAHAPAHLSPIIRYSQHLESDFMLLATSYFLIG